MKKFFTLILTVGIVSCLTPATHASANEKGSIAMDVTAELNSMGMDYYKDVFLNIGDNKAWYNKNPKKVSTNLALTIDPSSITDSSKLIDITPTYIGENVFINTSSTIQKYDTTSFESTVTETRDATTTKPILNLPSNFVVDILVDGATKKLNINPSSSDTVKISETKKVIIPSQPTFVKPGKSTKVIVKQYQNSYESTIKYKATGTNVKTEIDTYQSYLGFGGALYERPVTLTRTPSDMFNQLPKYKQDMYLAKGIQTSGSTVLMDGEAKVTEIYGTRLIAQTYEVDLPTKETETGIVAFYPEDDTNLDYKLVDTKVISSDSL